MTVPPGRSPDDESRRRHERRFVYLSVAVVALLAVLLAVGLKLSMDGRRALCPPGNPECGLLPPSAPPAVPPAPGTPPH